MKLTLKKGTRLMGGNQPFELLSDYAVEVVGVADGDYDGLAAALSGAHHALYGFHVADLAHEETVQRFCEVDGKNQLCDVKLAVSYGALGSRVETPVGEPVPVKAKAPATPPTPPTPAPVEVPDDIEPSFPGYVQLTAVSITKRSELKGKTVEEIEQVPGIAPETARAIYKALNPLSAEDIAKIKDQSRLDVHASHAETAAAEAAAAEGAAPVDHGIVKPATAAAEAPITAQPQG